MAIRFCALDIVKGISVSKELSNQHIGTVLLDENNKFSSIAMNDNCSIKISNEPIVFDELVFYNASLFFDTHRRQFDYLPIINKNGEFVCFCYLDVEHEKLREIIMELCSFDNIPRFDENHRKIVLWGLNENAYYFHLFLEKQQTSHYLVGELWSNITSDYYEDFEINNNNINILFEGNYALPISESAFGQTVLEWFEDNHHDIFEFYSKCCVYKNVLDYKASQLEISKHINTDAPMFMGRVGNTELAILKEYYERKAGVLSHYSPFWLDFLYDCCGFFGNNQGIMVDEDVDKYAEITIDAIKNCDINICWGDNDLASGLSFVLDKLEKKNSIRVNWDNVRTPSCCFDYEKRINALEGKKVLVISPFINTIQKQYSNRTKLFNGEDIFPNCEIITYKAPETQMGNYMGYSSWFEIFNKMISDIQKIDFDIALIGAGSYGFPLASEIKKLGKKAISLSSILANWFGIKNKRYCAYGPVNKNWNSWWRFPEETPPDGYEKIEEGCYWR